MNQWIGRSVVVIGVLHTLAGLLEFHSSLWAIAREQTTLSTSENDA
jgi:hypothetical protein